MNEELDGEIRENYRKIASESLIAIAQNVDDDYTKRAVELARAELAGRGVNEIPEPAPPPPAQPPDEEPEVPDLSRSVVLREYGDEMEAGTALLWLAAENIRAFIWQDDRGEDGPGPRPPTGVRLAVPEGDREAAEDILRVFKADPGD
jgi:hypothetical protein